MKIFLVHPRLSASHDYLTGELSHRTPGLSWHAANPSQHVPSDAFVFSYAEDFRHPHIHLLADSGLWDSPPDLCSAPAAKTLEATLKHTPEADLPGLIFFLLSRAEEYLPDVLDEEGRFRPEKSLLYLKKLHREPLVESRLIPALIRHIQKAFPQLECSPRRPTLLHTFDIDHAYAYYGKPLFRQLGGALRDAVSCRPFNLEKRLKSLCSPRNDPFNSYDAIVRLSDEGHRVICFWQGVSSSPPDNNIPLKSRAASHLLNCLKTHVEVGLHPSTRHRDKPAALAVEKKMLEEILRREVLAARTHFLVMKLPETYRMMEQCGIREDFSMGWARISGFRAGTCHPFLFFDCQARRSGSLLIYPTCCMDGVLHDKEHLRGMAFLEAFRHYALTTAEYGGVFVNHWHNHTIGTEGHWPDGHTLFQESLKILREYY